MFMSLAVTGTLGLVVYCSIKYRSFTRYIAEARSTGLPCTIVPFGLFSPVWALLQVILLPVLDRTPASWTERWLPYLLITRGWHAGYEPFQNMGSDTYITVSPTGNILYTCDPEAANQILRSNAFDKPADLMDVLNIFGPTMTGTSNKESRLYRKTTAPFFNDRTMSKVWTAAISGAETALEVLTQQQQASTAVGDLRPTLAKLSLYLLSSVCLDFGGDCRLELEGRGPTPEGQSISYSKAMHTLLDHFPLISFTPPILLRHSFLTVHKQAYQAYAELRTYIEGVRNVNEEHIRSQGMKSKPLEEQNIADLIVGAGDLGGTIPNPALSPPAVLGNIFIFMFAGHEANANTLLFVVLLLACHPAMQRDLQADIDYIVGGVKVGINPSTDWSYTHHYELLSHSMVGAVINEAMRLFTVLPFIPKCVASGSSPQPLKLSNNRTHMIPAETLILINTSAIHRHPRYWWENSSSSSSSADGNPVVDFNPYAWFNDRKGSEARVITGNAEGFFRPTPGSFIPFSDGVRGCLGKKFALVELVALVTRIFGEYSVELAVEEDSALGRDVAWEQARLKAEKVLFEGVTFKMSLRLSGKLPVSFVKRGSEEFWKS